MKVSTEIDNNFGYEKITQLVDNIPLNDYIYRTKLESKVNQEDLNVCDGQLSVEECTEGIFKMKLNKSPGIDGLTYLPSNPFSSGHTRKSSLSPSFP